MSRLRLMRDCPYFVGPWAPAELLASRAAYVKRKAQRKAKREAEKMAFIGPPKPHGLRRLGKRNRTSKYEWAKNLNIDWSTKEGRAEYNKLWYRNKVSNLRHLTEEQKKERKIAIKESALANKKSRQQRKEEKQRRELRDKYVRKQIRNQLGVKNPPQELIELKRVQLQIHRGLKNHEYS